MLSDWDRNDPHMVETHLPHSLELKCFNFGEKSKIICRALGVNAALVVNMKSGLLRCIHIGNKRMENYASMVKESCVSDFTIWFGKNFKHMFLISTWFGIIYIFTSLSSIIWFWQVLNVHYGNLAEMTAWKEQWIFLNVNLLFKYMLNN